MWAEHSAFLGNTQKDIRQRQVGCNNFQNLLSIHVGGQHTGSKKLRGATFVTIILLFGGVVLTLQARNTCVATKKASNKQL